MRFPSRPFALLVAAAILSLSAAAGPTTAQSDPSDPSEAIQEAWDLARTMPDAFGGLWLDAGSVVFAFTEAATDEQIADVLSLVLSDVSLAMVRVDHSAAALDATQDAITDAASAGELPFVTGVGVALQTNAVAVNVLPQYLLTCQAGLLERFGQVRLLFAENAGDVGAEAGESSGPPASLPCRSAAWRPARRARPRPDAPRPWRPVRGRRIRGVAGSAGASLSPLAMAR